MTVIERMGHLRMSQRGAHRPLLLTLVLLSACDLDAPTHAVAAARAPVAGKGPSTAAPTVTAVDPAQAPQDTTLDVTVYGSGFTAGARAVWSLGGDTTQVHVTSTRVVNAGRLVVRLVIPSTAPIASYDVEVMLSDGKKGVGAEKFLVTQKGREDTDSRALVVWDAEVGGGPAGITGDGRTADGATTGTANAYQGDQCGVHARIFNTPYASNSGDLVFDPDYTPTSCGSARTLRIASMDGGSYGSSGPFTNVWQIWQLTSGERTQDMRFHYVGLPDCETLHFDAGTYGGSSNVLVRRLASTSAGAAQWSVESIPPHQAMCTVTQKRQAVAKGLRTLPFRFTVTEIVPGTTP